MKRVNKRAQAFRLAARVPPLAAEHAVVETLLREWGTVGFIGSGTIAALRAAHEAAK